MSICKGKKNIARLFYFTVSVFFMKPSFMIRAFTIFGLFPPKTGYVFAIFFSWALLLFNHFARIYIFCKNLYFLIHLQHNSEKESERSAFSFFFHNVCGKCFELYFKLRVIGTKPSLVQTELLTRGKHRSGGGAWREG